MTADEVLLVLQGRYDYYSARTVFKQITTAAGVSPDGPFDGRAAGKLADALLNAGQGVDGAVDALREGASASKAPAKKPAAEKPAAKKPAAKKPAAKKPAAKKPAAAKK